MTSTAGEDYEELLDAHRRLQQEFRQFREDHAILMGAVVHELRTRLQPIIGFIGLIDPGASAEHWREYIPPVLQEGERLARAITNLHYLNEVDGGRMTFEPSPVAVAGLVDRVVREWRFRAPGRSFILKAGRELPPVLVDPGRAAEALDILVSNAVRFSPEGSDILIRAEAEGDGVALSVQGEGPGIPAEYRGAAFAKIVEIPAGGGRSRWSLGLGLYAAREMARRMGGDVQLVETGPGGTTFSLLMPVAKPDVD